MAREFEPYLLGKSFIALVSLVKFIMSYLGLISQRDFNGMNARTVQLTNSRHE